MTAAFLTELVKLARRPAIWTLAAILFALSVAFGYLIPYLILEEPSGGAAGPGAGESLDALLPDAFLGNVISGFPLFGGALVLIAGVLTVGSEYGWETLRTILTQRPGRLQILGGKLLALAVVVVVFALAVFLPGALGSYLVALAEDAPVDWPPAGEIVQALAAGWLIYAMWAAAGAVLAVLFRGTALPIGLGLVWLLVVEGLIRGLASQSDLLAGIEAALPGANAGSLAASFLVTESDTPGVEAVVGATQATFVLLAYGAVFILLAGHLFRRRDIA